MKRVLLFLVPWMLLQSLYGQRLQWDTTAFRFPTATDQNAPLHHTFTFRNIDTLDVSIRDVLPGSDILVENFTKGLIPPGGKGFLKATVTPSHITGPFTRSITLYTDEKEHPEYILSLLGEIKVDVDPVAARYPLAIGNLKYKPFYHLFFNLKITEVRTDTIFLYNAWDRTMQLSFDSLPDFLRIVAVPEKLKSKKEGYLLVTYDAAKRNDFDMVFNKVTLKTNDALEPEKTLDIIAVIVEDFDALRSGDPDKFPVATLGSLEYDFGNIQQGSIARYSLRVTNTGTDTLIIRKTTTSCSCTVSKPDKDRLAPMESATIQISFNTFGRMGRQSKTVTIYTNDPENPSQIFTISGIVQ